MRHVAVTGAASGIGRAVAREAARRGVSTLWLIDRDADGLKHTAEEISGCDARQRVIDLVDRTAVGSLGVEWTGDTFPDVVVNCAGIRYASSLTETTDAEWDATLAVNATGVFLLMRAAASTWIENGVRGVIVNIASVAAEIGFTDRAAYCASKSAVLGLTRAAALDLAPHGIRVIAISPGFTASGMSDELDDSAVADEVPLGRRGDPNELAKLIFDVAGSSFITGANIVVDGGALAGHQLRPHVAEGPDDPLRTTDQ